MRRLLATASLLAMLSAGLPALDTATQTAAAKPEHAKQTEGAAKPNQVSGKQPTAKARQKPSLRRKKVPVQVSPPPPPAPVVSAPAQVAPPVPATLMNQPPVSPTVTLNGGLLTIDAPNSVLGDVLAQVSKLTGAVFDGPMATERVAVRLGPGDPRQVIAALLQGTPYNYLILGSPEQPEAVTRIELTPVAPATNEPPPPAIAHPQPPPEPAPAEVPNPQETQAVPTPPPPPPQAPQQLQPPGNSPEALFRALLPGSQPPAQQPQPKH